MNQVLAVCIMFIGVNLIFAQKDLAHHYKLIYGKWGDSNGYAEFLPDSTYNQYYFGELAKAVLNFQVEDIDTLTPWKHGEMGYYLSFEEDSLVIHYFPVRNIIKEEKKSYILLLNKDEKVSLTFKKGKGIDDHIDEVSYSRRFTEEQHPVHSNFPEEEVNSKFIVPEGFTGYVVVVYNPDMQQAMQSGEMGKRIFEIPNDGLLETDFTADPVTFATQKYGFYYRKYNENELVRLPLINRSINSPIMIQTTFIQEYLKQFNPNSMVVIPFGYNQIARNLLNKKFNKNIIGNAEIYYVGVLRDLIGNQPPFVEK